MEKVSVIALVVICVATVTLGLTELYISRVLDRVREVLHIDEVMVSSKTRINIVQTEIAYSLSFSDLERGTAAHIHLGRKDQWSITVSCARILEMVQLELNRVRRTGHYHGDNHSQRRQPEHPSHTGGENQG